MALLNFKYGIQQNLPAKAVANAGNVYITTDTKKMFVELPKTFDGNTVTSTEQYCISDFQLINWTKSASVTSPSAALSAWALKDTSTLYLTVESASGATAMWRYNGTGFVAISNSEEMSAIVADIADLKTAVQELNTFKNTTVPNTYMPLAGGQFTGDVSFKGGEYLTVNAPRTGDAGKKDAATREYVDTAKSDLLGSSTATTTSNATIYDVKRAAAAAQETATNAATAASNANDNADTRVLKSGDTMTGPLTLSGAPTAEKHAATKKYVDDAAAKALSDAKTYTNEREAAIMGNANSETGSATVYGVKKKAEENATAIDNLGKSIGTANGEIAKKAPILHSSADTTYGIGTSALYGHVKLSDATDGTSDASAGVAATPKAVQAAYARGSQGITDAAAALRAAEGAQSTASAAMPKTGGEFTGDVSFKSGEYLTVNAPRAGDAGANDAAPRTYVDTAINGANSTAQGYVDAFETEIRGGSTGTLKGAYDAAAAANTLAGQAKDVADDAMPKAGGTFSGDVTMGSGKTLTVNAPTAGSNQAATAKYVDDAKAAAISAVQGKTGDTKDSATVVGAKLYTDSKIDGVNSEISTLKTNIGNLSNIMNFLGTTTSEVAQDATITSISIGGTTVTAVKGDVVVKGAKEFVFDGTYWQEIGDVSAQSTAIDGLLDRMDAAEGDIDNLEERMDTAEGDIDNLEKRVGANETGISDLDKRMDAAETDIDNLQATVGTKPTGTGIPAMDNTLWEEVSDLRADLGEKDAAAGTATAFARIKQVETYVGTSNDAASTNALTTGSLYARVKKNANDITSINTAIGTASDAANAAGSIYARIKYNYETNDQILDLLTWGTF